MLPNRADIASKPERVAAILGVIDEVELIGDCIANFRKIGVDHIIVGGLGSVDGALDVLSSYNGDSDFAVHYWPIIGAGKYETIDFLTLAYQAAPKTVDKYTGRGGGGIEAEYERQCLSTEQLNQYASVGVIENVRD